MILINVLFAFQHYWLFFVRLKLDKFSIAQADLSVRADHYSRGLDSWAEYVFTPAVVDAQQ